MKGKTVLCEKCGFPFKSEFTKKDYKQMGSPPIQAPILKRTQQLAYSGPKQSQNSKKYRYEPTLKKNEKKFKHGVKIHSSGLKEKIPVEDLENLKKSIRIMNDINGSPLIIIIGILILASSIPRVISTLQTDLFPGIMQIVVNSYRFILIILLWSINYRIVIKPIKEQSYTNLGIDAMLIGLIGLPLYGLGTFFLFEGLFILLYEIFLRINNLIDMGKTDKLSEEIFAANFMESTIKVINNFLVKGTIFLLFYSIIPVLKEVRDYTLPSAEFISVIVFYGTFLIIAIAFTFYLGNKFVPKIRNTAYQKIDEEIFVRCIIFSAFSLIYAGVGSLGLVICILLFIYRGLYKDIKKKLPSMHYEKPKPPIAVKEPSRTESTTKPESISFVLEAQKDIVPKEIFPTPPPKEDRKPLQEIPVIHVEDKHAREQLISSLRKTEKEVMEKPPSKTPELNRGNIKEYMGRVFTVLTADMRERLLKLEIPDEQKWDVVREFANLKEQQQQKYIEELENVNRVLSEELIKRVQKMNLPIKETQSIIRQLEIMDPKEQVQFVEFLEHTQ